MARQDRLDLICESEQECERCILFPVCDKYMDDWEKPKEFHTECEELLDKEAADER